PVPLGDVAGAGEAEGRPRVAGLPEQPAQGLVDRPVALAVAPGGHDHRAGEDPRALLPGPADGVQELVGPIRLPVGEQEFRLRRRGVGHLAAEDAVHAVLRLEVAVAAEGAAGDAGRQGPAELAAVAPETGIEDGDFDALAAVAAGVPAVHAQ